MKICVIAITKEGRLLAKHISASLEGCTHDLQEGKVADKLRQLWPKYDAFICVMATGIVVRSIAPLIKDKKTDPCIIVTDQKGSFVISLLSGHLGGGNDLAVRVADITNGQPVITTASDILGKTPLDLWAKRNDLIVSDTKKLTSITSDFINGKSISVYREGKITELPHDLEIATTKNSADIIITFNNNMTFNALCCIPRALYLGIGCNRGTDVTDITNAFEELCDRHDISPLAFVCVCTIDVKNDEQGILNFAKERGFSLSFFSRDEINQVQDVSFSTAAMKAVGAQGVAEPTALLGASGDGSMAELIIRKMKWKDVTMAVAEREKNRWD